MKVGVLGLWHLGCVTAACLADMGHEVFAWDPDENVIAGLRAGKAPVFEPQLDNLIQKGLQNGLFRPADGPAAFAEVDIIWVTLDTPVDDQDVADVACVEKAVLQALPFIRSGALMLISSQLPVGTLRRFSCLARQQCPDKKITMAYVPENLRLGSAISVFMQPDRIIVGLEDPDDKKRITTLFGALTDNLIWMSPESAEMTKHALNAFLALSVTFINEIAGVCEKVGADGSEVERGLKSELRIGQRAYLRPGAAIAGGTLLRDVNYLIQTGEQVDSRTCLLEGLLKANEYHKTWLHRKIKDEFSLPQNARVTLLGLTYKPGTDTLRRSAAIEIGQWLHQEGIHVTAYDPVVSKLPQPLDKVISLEPDLDAALRGADVAIVMSNCDHFQQVPADQWVSGMKTPVILDPAGWLGFLSRDARIIYRTVGRVQ